MKKQLTLSIIVPAYNEEHHLKACLDSIAKQTVKPDEVIVVNNNSSDKTIRLAKKYPFVKLLSEAKQGVVFARDRGFNAAKSQLIGRIDADTILPLDWVERVHQFYAYSEHQQSGLTGGCYFYNMRIPRVQGWFQGQIAFRYNRLLMGHYIFFGSNMVLPRSIWLKVRYKLCHDIDVHEDLDLAIHVHRAGYPINYLENLRVGVKMRRVRSQHDQLWDNIMWWPKTLRRHGKKTWIFGWLGAVLFYTLSPLESVVEAIARFVGRRPLPE